MQIAVRMAAELSTGRISAQSKADPMPSIVRPIIHGKTFRRTKFKNPKAAGLPSLTDLSARTGTIAAVKAPSPSSRRNRFGIWNAKMKAEPMAEHRQANHPWEDLPEDEVQETESGGLAVLDGLVGQHRHDGGGQRALAQQSPEQVRNLERQDEGRADGRGTENCRGQLITE